MNNDNLITMLGSAVTDLFTANAGFFQAIALKIFGYLIIIRIFRTGLSWVWPGVSGGRRLSVARMVVMLLLTSTLLRYYATPMPGMSVGFYKIFSETARGWSAQLEGGVDQAVQVRVADVYTSLEAPGINIGAIGQWIWYLAIITLLAGIQFVMVAIIAVGFFAVGLAALLGPIFIAFLALDETSWLFKAWVRSYVTYCLYQVAAAGMIFITGTALLKFFDRFPPPYTLAKVATIFLIFTAMAMSALYGMLRVPSIVASLIAGRGGESGFRV